MTKITYIKKETEGEVKEELHFICPDVRYPNIGGIDVQMALEQATELRNSLDKRLADIPF